MGGSETRHGRREPPASGFEQTTLGLGEAGPVESGECVELAFERVEALLEFERRRAEGRGARRRGIARAARVAQQAFAREGVGGGPGGAEGLGFAGAQAVLVERVGEAALLRDGERTDRVGGGGGELPDVHARGELGRELAGEHETALDRQAARTAR